MEFSKRLFFTFLLLLVTLSLPNVGQAQDSSGIGLTPSLIEEGADPGEILTEEISIRNLSGEQQTYFLYTRDISGVQNGGSPIFAEEGTEKTGYELSEWITLGENQITLFPGEEKSVSVEILVPESATPGSHFGGIFVSLEPPRLRSSGAGVGYQVASIVSIRISGDVTESARIRSLSTDKLVYGETNVKFMARVENQGNVLVRPNGPLEVFNMLGEKVVNVPFNESHNAVFPGVIRDFELVWEDEGLGFGRYEAVLSLIYGEHGTAQSTITSSVTFWVLPMKIIKPALIVLGILLIGSYVTVRLYVRRTIQRMSGGRRLVRSQQRGPSTLLLVAIIMLCVTVVFLVLLLALFA